jgi:hypothetical protein
MQKTQVISREPVRSVNLVLTGHAIASLRESDFDTCSAVGEVIDNSIQAGASIIKLAIKEMELPNRGRRKGGSTIVELACGDNGTGMTPEILHHCLQLGYSTRYNNREGIGRFGVGMTLAAINQCKCVEIYSKVESSAQWRSTRIDLDAVVENPFIPEPVQAALPETYRHLVGQDRGTLVIWSKFDRHTQELPEIAHWISRTYRKFIASQIVMNGKLQLSTEPVAIEVNGSSLEPWDPLYVIPNSAFPSGELASLAEPIELEIDVPADAGVLFQSSKIVIQMSLTPKHWRPEGGGASGRSDIAKNLRLDENEGFSILRAGREVFYDEMPHFEPKPHADGLDRWWSAEISFDPCLDSYFSVKNVKRGARFVRQLRERIQERMLDTISEFRRVVKEVWKDNRQKDNRAGVDVTTTHTEAEKAVKAVDPTPVKAGKSLTPDQREAEIKEILSGLIKNEQDLDAWRAKIENQPTTIVDNEGTQWRGSTFLDIHPQGGRTIIEYNMAHEFFLFVYGAIKDLDARGEGSEHLEIVDDARRLKAAIDLLFMAFAQAEGLQDPNHQQRVGDTLDFLKSNWGSFLRQFVLAFESSDQISAL